MERSSRRLTPILVLIFLIPLLAFPVSPVPASVKETTRVESAVEVIDKIMQIPEQAIPPNLLANAHGIAIVPGVIKVGLVVGGQYGNGVLLVRGRQGGWSPPVFIKLISGSVGWQIGAQATDFVMVFKTSRSVEGILKGTFTLGADAAVAAGPVGRRAEAATDLELKAEIYSYSRSRGLFAGVSLEGSSLQVDHEGNAAFYGKADIRPSEIVEAPDVQAPAAAETLRRTVERHAPAPAKP